MGDSSYQYCVALKWDEDPSSLRRVKNKLLLHFQSKNKSNGGECEIQDLDCSRGYILIHFKEERVRDQVLQKQTHELQLPGGKKLKLDVSSVDAVTGSKMQEASAKPEKDELTQSPAVKMSQNEPSIHADRLLSNVVLIENVQDSCSSEMLTLLIENISVRNDDTDFYLERIHEIRSAVITFTCDIDVFSFIENFSKHHRVNQQKLMAKPLEETRSIRAEGLPPNTEVDLLIIYFESSKFGGGSVQEAMMIPEEEAALVTFSDSQIVQVIVEKEHIFGKKAISVYRYYPSLNITLYGRKRPCVVRPPPIRIPISQYLLEFIWKDSKLKQSMEKNMSDKMCEIIWPDLNCPNPEITLAFPNSLSSHLRTMAKVARTWAENVSAEFSLIISRYKVVDCKMTPAVWEDIQIQIATAAYDGVLIKPSADTEKIFLAGTMKDVNKIEYTFRKLVEEITKKAERRSQVTTTTEPMSAALYHVICSSGLEEKIRADVPELRMEYDPSTHHVKLTGLRDEILQAKYEILSVKQNLKSKFLQLNPHVLQFLMFADNDEVSCLLFIRHNINALMEMEDNAIRLTGYTKQDLMDAEEQINREIIFQQIPIEDKNVLQSPEWRSLQAYLLESLNSKTYTVIIREFPPGAESDVVVTGLSSNVQLGCQQIRDFVKDNSVIEVIVPIRSNIMMQFIEEKEQQAWQKIKMNVKVVKNENSLSLFAPRMQADDAAAQVRKLLSSLYSDSLRIDKSGAKKFCKNYEEILATTAKTKFDCMILLETGGDNRPLDKAQYEVKLQSRVTLAVYQDDLCRHNVDVIVNAANEDLQHCGGLALALLRAAGPKLQDDCDGIIRKEGRLSSGDSVITDAGNLPCKQVIHAVGPTWNSQTQVKCEQALQRAITNSLQLAADNGHSSIAIPAISSGIFNFPLKKCAKNILDAIDDYVEKEGSASSIQRIHLVDTNLQTSNVFSELLRTRFGDEKRSGAPVTSGPQTSIKSGRSEKPQITVNWEDKEVRTTEGLIIRLVQKNIEDATTDVMVNSVGCNLNLTEGNISRAIYNRAGSGLQQLLIQSNLGARASAGTVISTDGCNLSCQNVLHVVIPHWDDGQGASEMTLRETIQKCLMWTDQQQMMSLSIPALGTGKLMFPKALVAAAMFDAIIQFSSKNKPQNLQEVEIVLHPSDKHTIQAFYNQLANCTDGGSTGKKQNHGPGSVFCGTVSSPNLGVYEMRIGSLTFQAKTGDITKEGAEVIVNSTNNKFTLHSGVSKAILEAAGLSVQLTVRALGSQPHKGFVITDSGNIAGSSWILHVPGPTQPAEVKKIVLDCLQESENYQAACVAFPVLGTGAGGLAATVVADAILDGVMDFINSGSMKSIQTVQVIIFQQHMLNDFYMSMKKKEGTPLPGPKSFLSKLTALLMPKKQKQPVQKLTAFQLLDNIEPVIFSLCSDDKEKVLRTKQWLQQQIEYEQTETKLEDEYISELEVSEYEKILTLQKKFQVSVVYKPPDPSIRISGLTRDVHDVLNGIQKIVNCVKDRKSRERAAELTGNLVEWRYEQGFNMIAFDSMANLELEEAKNANKAHITVQSRNQKIIVDLKNLKGTDKHGNQMEIKRTLKHEEISLKLPDHWQPMNNCVVMEVDVSVTSTEYAQVNQLFAKTCQSRIRKIKRVQNKDLWLNYQIKRQSIDAKNRTTTNERQLFHGTDENSIQHINHNGFNRGFAGKHAAVYGKGTYFAVNAHYSARGYSPPDAKGRKHMYLARVLTGEFCAGQQGMVAPPAKNSSNSTELYDSVTDNPRNPSMFIIFNDIQAYPEYHITFC